MTGISTEYGPVYFEGPCRDNYSNIMTYIQPGVQADWHDPKLQEPAMKALWEAERKYARKTRPWKRKRPIRLTGSWRDCDIQRALYNSDPDRYAHPDTSAHCRGLAIDVHTGALDATVHRCLKAAGWTQSRPDDEIWHYSYGVTR